MLNKVTLIGNLGQNPELKQVGDDNQVCNFSLATSYKDKTEWHRITCWNRLAENCSQYLSKGSKVYIEGRLETRKWTDKDGNTRYTTEIVAHEVKFLDIKRSGNGGPPPPGDEDVPF